MEAQELLPDPQQLRAEAEKEPARHGLEGYSDVIQLLKDEKGFSFREIAAWLQERGMKVDHNGVWRAYSKVAQGRPIASQLERNELSELHRAREEAMPWLTES